VTEYKILTQWI